MATTTSDGVFAELQREIDEFVATHGSSLHGVASATSIRVEIAESGLLEAPLARVRWMATAMSDSRFCETIQCLLSWLTTVESAGQHEENRLVKVASWLAAYLVGEILLTRKASPSARSRPSLSVERVEKATERVLDRCIVVFQEAYGSDAARAVESGGGFFAFKSATTQFKASTPESTLQESVAHAWRYVVSLVSLGSLNPFRHRLQRQLLHQLLQTKIPNSKDHLLLKNILGLRLGLDTTTFLWRTNTQQKVKDAALFLKMLHPLTLKPHKPPTRLAAISTIGAIINQELNALDHRGLQRFYSSIHSVEEWTSCLSDLHSSTLKLCGKREFAIAAWVMRVAALSVMPNEIFSRYWKEDIHVLLRIQYQHNKDGGGSGSQAVMVLDCVERCFTHMLKRHFLTDRRIPGELDCMEIINSTQAWCFFSYPKQRSLEKLQERVIPALVKISLGIASYNMLYAIQSHLRRLLVEADHIFDEKKLVGLESLLALCRLSLEDGASPDASLPLDCKALLANRATLGEHVGQTLIEANAVFGGELMIEPAAAQGAGSSGGIGISGFAVSTASKLLRDEYKRSVAIQSYACALASLHFLYTALELSDEQKILILVRSCIQKEIAVRNSAAAALHKIIRGVRQQASRIFRGMTEYMFRLSSSPLISQDLEAFVVLVEVLASLLRLLLNDPTDSQLAANPWENHKAKQESLLQIESVAVFLLVFEDPRLSNGAVEMLEVVAQLQSEGNSRRESADAEIAPTVERPSVIDVFQKADYELRDLLFCFESQLLVQTLASRDLGFFRQLISDLSENPRGSFRWSIGLSVVFAHLGIWTPEVAVFMWSDVNDKVAKLEPVMPSSLEITSNGTDLNLPRWRNLALLATATACPYLLVQSSSDIEGQSEQDPEDSKNCSVQSIISSSAVQALFKRLCRYLRSSDIEQKKAVILALGSTHVSSFPILTEVFQKYESEAFTLIEQPVSSRHGSLNDIQPSIGFVANGVANGPGPRRATKEQKARNLKLTSQLNLQWALGRCYRLLLQSTQQRPLLLDDSTREALLRLEVGAMGVINKIGAALSSLQDHQPGQVAVLDKRDAPHHIVFMMQQDFCSSVRVLSALLHENRSPYFVSVKKQKGASRRMSSVSTKRSVQQSSSASLRSDSSATSGVWSAFDLKQRENWFYLLLGWCQSFSSLANPRLGANLSGAFFVNDSPARDHWLQRCDVVGELFDDTKIPWHWVDEADVTRALGIQEAAMASFQRYFLCQTVIATISVLVDGPLFISTPVTHDAAVVRWLDECFAVDVSSNSSDLSKLHHFQILQLFCHRVLNMFLECDFLQFAEVCVEKSFFSVSSGDKHNIAKHYFRALCEFGARLKCLFKDVAAPQCCPHEGNDETQYRQHTCNPRNHSLEVKVCHAIIMHLGVDGDPTHRRLAVDLINELYHDADGFESVPFCLNTSISSTKRSSATFGAQVVNRMQVAGASFLARNIGSLAFQMSMSMLKFLSCSELSLQQKTLAAVLPWLAEVKLSSPCGARGEELRGPSNTMSAFDADQLLSLLFRITTNLGASCSEQLERVWLTLSFAESSAATENHEETNLSKVLQFLFMQRTTSVRLSTAKIVVWWLSRWQNAVHDVLRELLVMVEVRRRESVESHRPSTPDLAMIQPVDDVFVFVILASDSCCLLASASTYLEDPSMREAMMIQTMHVAFLSVFALILNPSAFATRRMAASPSGTAEHHQHHQIYDDVFNDCLVLLRNLVGQLYGPREVLEQVVDNLASWWLTIPPSIDDPNGAGTKAVSPNISTRPLEELMASFASCLPTSSRRLWAFECVKELALALVPGSTLLQQTASRCNNIQVLCCVRFGLLGYRVLSMEFHGDVVLTLLDLLHHALNEHARNPADAGAVLGETLRSLQSIVSGRPSQKLVLYPQLVWVCVALLNYGSNRLEEFQQEVVHLLVEIFKMPHFATNGLLHDVLLSKKPQQWDHNQASLLRAMVWCIDRAPPDIQRQILRSVVMLLVLPFPLYHDDSVEHLIISSTVLLPYMIAALNEGKITHKQFGSESEVQSDRDSPTVPDPIRVTTDLAFAWLGVGSSLLSEVFTSLQSSLADARASPEHESEHNQALAQQFASAFVSELGCDDSRDALITMTFEILVKILAAADSRKRYTTTKAADEVVTATLWIVEGLLGELSRFQVAWRPTSKLLGSLARLIRHPEQTPTWRAAVRILSLLGACSWPSSGPQSSSVEPNPRPHITVAITNTSGNKRPQQSLSSPSSSSDAREDGSAPGTPTSKRAGTLSGARKFMNFLGQKASANQNQASSNNREPVVISSSSKLSIAQDPAEERIPSPPGSQLDL